MNNHRSTKLFRIFLVFACLLAIGFAPTRGLADTEIPGDPQAPAVDVLIVVVPAATNVNVGSTFSVKVQIQSGTQLVDAAQASINFDQTKLSVTSLTGNPTAFPTLTQNTFDNTNGTIDYAATTASNYPSGNIDLVTIQFSALAAVQSTPITFQYGTRNTDIRYGASSVLTSDQDGQVQIGLFNKSSPANAATNVVASPTLSWTASLGTTGYEYCYDTTNDNACSTWTSAGTNTSVILLYLNGSTTYYWHVRAINSLGGIYSDGSNTAFWSFTTGVLPGAFAKTSPANGATGVSLSPTLSWGTSTNTTSYEYCYDTTNDNDCAYMTSVGTNTSVTLSGLSLNTTYYWNAKAVNNIGRTYPDGGQGTSFWSFTTGNVPGAFTRTSPANGATGVSLTLTLSWGASSGAASYEYCYDSTNDSACSAWTSTGTNTSQALSGLSANTTYYWHVRANNSFGVTYADGAAATFWSFITGVPPGAFVKSNPGNGATAVPLAPTLSWAASTGVASYEYCYDTTNDNACSSWTSAGTATSAALSGLSLNTTYYWQVRAVNAFGTTYANGAATAFWSFTTGNVPGAFAKANPANGATAVTLAPTLSWGASTGAVSYEYCYDTSNDNACNGWTGVGSNTSVALSGLNIKTTYYWQVRAVNSFGTTYANGGAYWYFTSLDVPGAFAKSTPGNEATEVLLAPTLSWGTSTGAVSYEYCYDTTDDDACTGTWTSTGSNNSIPLSGLVNATIYYWQVRAINEAGTTYANASAWWSFTTSPYRIYMAMIVH